MIQAEPAIPSRFRDRIHQEFVEGSAIAPSLFEAAIDFCEDIEMAPGGEVTTPIHDALNWQYTRFGHQAREPLEAAIFRQETGEPWQAKLSSPVWDAKKGEYRKYESPKGNGSQAYLPRINRQIRRAIAKRYGVGAPPLGESFWTWLEQHPEIPITLTEGGKKALCLLSLGYVAISLYGASGGYRVKDGLGNPIAPVLIPDLQNFCTPGREIILGFDQDLKIDTRGKVSRALSRFGGLLTQQGCSVRVALWNGGDGKGVDDLVVGQGPGAWEQAYDQAMPLEHWRLWLRLENQLTYQPSIRLKTQDLSSLEIANLPETGILAIASPKGTGKTKFVGGLLEDSQKVILGGHRVCLMRNLCQRLGIHYRGDLDKAGGQFVSGTGYTLRVGLCLDSLLAVDPEKFTGCDLVLDEAVQVLRHLLTSATCRKDGKLPALLARFHRLVQVARRVILADADLNNAVLAYVQELRGEGERPFLIRNNCQSQGYPVRFIEAPDASVITAELLKDIQNRKPGEVFLIQTDSKAGSKTLAKLIEEITAAGARTLLINSETSGGEVEKAFIQNPDQVLAEGKLDVIVASPSMATGVSIEAQGTIAKVFGVFYGASSTDADMAQALARVREPVERVIWCAKRGTNFSKAGRYTNPLELKGALKTRTDSEISLIRSSLREDQLWDLSNYDWQSDPHLNLWSRIEAERNFSMHNLRTSLLVRLQHEGHQMTIEQQENDSLGQYFLKQARQAIKEQEAAAIAGARPLTASEAREFESREGLSPEDQRAIARYHLADFYVSDAVDSDLVLWDSSGRRRRELLSLEAQLFAETAIERDKVKIEKQQHWKQGFVPWDLGDSELQRKVREILGLQDFFDPEKEWTQLELKSYADRARQYAKDIKTALNFSIREGMSDTQIVHQLLSQLGIKTTFRWSRSYPGQEGKKVRVYRLDPEHWQQLQEVLGRRLQRRDERSSLGTPPLFMESRIGGVPGVDRRLCPLDSPQEDHLKPPNQRATG